MAIRAAQEGTMYLAKEDFVSAFKTLPLRHLRARARLLGDVAPVPLNRKGARFVDGSGCV